MPTERKVLSFEDLKEALDLKKEDSPDKNTTKVEKLLKKEDEKDIIKNSNKRYAVVHIETSPVVKGKEPLVKEKIEEPIVVDAGAHPKGFVRVGSSYIPKSAHVSHEQVNDEDYENYAKEKEGGIKKSATKLIKWFTQGLPETPLEGVKPEVVSAPTAPLKINENIEKTPEVKKSLEKNILSKEDFQIQQRIYKEIEHWKEVFTRQYNAEEKNKINKTNFVNLKSSPYKWLHERLKSENKKLEAEIQKLSDTDENEKKLKEKKSEILRSNKKTQEDLKVAITKRIPLKLERNFTPEEIMLRDRHFNVIENKATLNKYFAKETDYTIEGLIQKGHDRFLLLRTSAGELLEFPTKHAYQALQKTETKNSTEHFINDLQVGDQVEFNQAGKTIVYTILSKNEDVVEYKTEKGGKGSMTFDTLKKFLDGEGVSFKNITKGQEIKKVQFNKEIEESIKKLQADEEIRIAYSDGKSTIFLITNVDGDTVTFTHNLAGEEERRSISKDSLKKYLEGDADISLIKFTKAENPETTTEPLDKQALIEQLLAEAEEENKEIDEEFDPQISELQKKYEKLLKEERVLPMLMRLNEGEHSHDYIMRKLEEEGMTDHPLYKESAKKLARGELTKWEEYLKNTKTDNEFVVEMFSKQYRQKIEELRDKAPDQFGPDLEAKIKELNEKAQEMIEKIRNFWNNQKTI
jgi:hypothetical protein